MNSVADTLVNSDSPSERTDVFDLAPMDASPLDGPNRTLTIWVGSRWAEFDAKTRKFIRRGKV